MTTSTLWQDGSDHTGATNFMGKIVFMGEGQGDKIAPAIYVMEPTAPYNTTGQFPMSNHLTQDLNLTDSHLEQLLWSSVQLTERCRHTPP